jgi:hypothetical protein
VVLAETEVELLPDVTGVTSPGPGEMVSEVAPSTFQDRVAVPPSTGRLVGLTEKVTTVGGVEPQLQPGNKAAALSKTTILAPIGAASLRGCPPR